MVANTAIAQRMSTHRRYRIARNRAKHNLPCARQHIVASVCVCARVCCVDRKVLDLVVRAQAHTNTVENTRQRVSEYVPCTFSEYLKHQVMWGQPVRSARVRRCAQVRTCVPTLVNARQRRHRRRRRCGSGRRRARVLVFALTRQEPSSRPRARAISAERTEKKCI